MDPVAAHRWMSAAFDLARLARGTTLPNPAVGCVVLDREGTPVAQAATSPTGRPHAERQALEKAGDLAQGGTLVVTLEPCVAFPGKKSPPCAAAAILSGVQTVVVGSVDPNPLVAGKGIHALRKAGIDVILCDLDGSVPSFYEGFGKFLATGMPRVTVKVALSRDGFMAAGAGRRTAITGTEANRYVHGLRAASDAILVGGSTARIDDPELTVRRIEGRSPQRFVLWPREGLPSSLKLWSLEGGSTACGHGPRPAGLSPDAHWLPLPACGRGVDLQALVAELGRRGCHDLLVEPGPGLLAGLLESGTWDRWISIRSPRDLGEGVPKSGTPLLPAVDPGGSFLVGEDRVEIRKKERPEPVAT